MKNKLLLLFALLFVNSSLSAQYRSIFGKKITSWHYLGAIFCDAAFCDSFYVNSDTIIKSKVYKEVKYLHKNYTGGRFFISEDTTLGKVWNYDSSTASEFLVMDLSLSLGDTFKLYDYSSKQINCIVDSVYNMSGKRIIRFNYFIRGCGLVDRFYFIEGVGSTAGFFYKDHVYESGVNQYLLSAYKDGDLEYMNKRGSDDCSIWSGINIHKDERNLIVVPQPFESVCTISMTNSKHDKLNIFITDMLGRRVFQGSTDTDSYCLDLSTQAPGIFIFHIIDKNGSESALKILKD